MSTSNPQDPLNPPTPPSDPGADVRDLVDRLADSTLDADGRTRLARAMERDDAVRADADSLEQVNARLKVFFAQPPAASIPISGAKGRGSRSSKTALLLVAACLVLAGITIGISLSGGGPEWGSKARDLYRSIEAVSFKPQEVCTTPEQFAKWTGENIGEALTPQLGVPGLELVGWNTAHTFSPYTGVLIAKVEGRGVIVFLDRAILENDTKPVKLGDGLTAFPAKIGSVGVIEVSPFDAPRVVPTISPATK